MKLTVLLLCITGTVVNTVFGAPTEDKLDYRLSTDVEPTDYVIDLTPHFDNASGHEAFTFDGSVIITLQATKANVKTITLHKEELDISEYSLQTKSKYFPSLSWNTQRIAIQGFEWDERTTKYSIILNEALVEKQLYELKFTYKGKLRTDMKGFYRSSYKEGDQIK